MLRLLLLAVLLFSVKIYSQENLNRFKDFLPEELYQYPELIKPEMEKIRKDFDLDPSLVYYRLNNLAALVEKKDIQDSVRQIFNFFKNKAFAERAAWAEKNLEKFRKDKPGYKYMDDVEYVYQELASYKRLPAPQSYDKIAGDTLLYFAIKFIYPDKEPGYDAAENAQLLKEFYKGQRREIENVYGEMLEQKMTGFDILKFIESHYQTFQNTEGVSVNNFLLRAINEFHSWSGSYFVGLSAGYYFMDNASAGKYTFNEALEDIEFFTSDLTSLISLSVGYDHYIKQYYAPFSFVSLEASLGYAVVEEPKMPSLYFANFDHPEGRSLYTTVHLSEVKINDLFVMPFSFRVSTPLIYFSRYFHLEGGASLYFNVMGYNFESQRNYTTLDLTIPEEVSLYENGHFKEKVYNFSFDPRVYIGFSYRLSKTYGVNLGLYNDMVMFKVTLIK